MSKACAYVLLITITIHLSDVRGNEYNGGGGWSSGGNPAVKQPQHSAPDTSVPSSPQYDSAGTGDQNYWWLTNNPFQKPANHPGVERGDKVSPGTNQPNPVSSNNQPSPHAGGSRPYTPSQNPNFAPNNNPPPGPQPSNPAPGPYGRQPNDNHGTYKPQATPQNNPNPSPNNQFQQNPAPFGVPEDQPISTGYGGQPQPPRPKNFNIPNPVTCDLTNKADCHRAAPGSGNKPAIKYQPQQPSNSYESPAPAPINQEKPSGAPRKPETNGDYGWGSSPTIQQPSTNYQLPPYSEPKQPSAALVGNKKPADLLNQNFAPQDLSPVSYETPDSNQPPAPGQNEPPQSKPQWQNSPATIQPTQQPQPQFSGYPSPAQQPQNSYNSIPSSPPNNPNNEYSPVSSPPDPSSNPVQNNKYQQPQAPNKPYEGQSANYPGSYTPDKVRPENPNRNPTPPAYKPNPQNNVFQKPTQPPRPNNFIPTGNTKPYNAANQNPNSGQNFSPPGNNNEDQLPYPGCPAAMLCIPDDYCNRIGIIEEQPVGLSPAEKLHRVALMSCSSKMTGIVGVCCRDPNYKDPWPDMNGGNANGEHHHHPDQGKPVQSGSGYSGTSGVGCKSY